MDWLLDILQEMGTTLRLPTSFVVIEFIGTFAFALSGIRLASAKHFDVFGAWIVGMATAIGGGTFRDLMLGVNPFWMTNSSYFICCGIAVFFVMAYGKYLMLYPLLSPLLFKATFWHHEFSSDSIALFFKVNFSDHEFSSD